MTLNKTPYYFSNQQVSDLARILGDYPELDTINLELSIAPTRHKINKVQNQVLKILTDDNQSFPLMLTDEEVRSLLAIELPQEIKGTLHHGIC